MKPKSATLRSLLVAAILFKYTDEKHKMTLATLNEHLHPYGLDCTLRSVKNTIKAMNNAGIDARYGLVYGGNGFWIDKRSLNDEALRTIAFAVADNPNLSKESAYKALVSLKPYVTSHQEHILCTEIKNKNESEKPLCDTYSVISEAIHKQRRVLYHTEFVRYNPKTKTIEKRPSYNALATPKYVCRVDNKLYMVCYHHTLRRVAAVDLEDITDIKLAAQTKLSNAESEIRKWLDDVNPWEYIPEANPRIVYNGPVTFIFKNKYLKVLLKRFGNPSGAVIQDTQYITEYTVPNAVITPKTLFWLTSLPDNGIRLKGPDKLIQSVRTYYAKTENILTDSRKRYLLWNALDI